MRSALSSLLGDLAVAWLIAVFFCVIASIPLTLIGLGSAYTAMSGGHAQLTFTEWLLTSLTVFASYFLAATLAAPVFWITRPLRPSLVGYVLAGVLIAPIVYGSVALAAYLAWEPGGKFFFGDHGDTRASFGASIPELLAVFAVVGAPIGVYFWWQDK